MTIAEDEMQFIEIYGDEEGNVSIAAISRQDYTIFDILRYLNCTWEWRSTNPENEFRMHYVGSGIVSRRNNKNKSIIFDYDVSCGCAHDCCGHLCSLRVEIQMSSTHFVITKTAGYNY